ncbi:MAG: hypothetical protein ACLR1V_06685 [Coprococcus sp.]
MTLRMVDIRALAGREVGRVIDKKWQKEELLQRKHTLSDVSETDVSKRLFGEEADGSILRKHYYQSKANILFQN